VSDLQASGLTAYLVEPPASDPDAPFRVRVGPFDTSTNARAAAQTLEKQRKEKLWVIRERP
jgi:hypothetical protein